MDIIRWQGHRFEGDKLEGKCIYCQKYKVFVEQWHKVVICAYNRDEYAGRVDEIIKVRVESAIEKAIKEMSSG